MTKPFPYKKAIVTGGAGFIGSHIVEALVKAGVETLSLDDYVAGKAENLAHLKKYSNFHEKNVDITDWKALEPCFDGVEVVFHQAASKKTICLNDPSRDLEVNANGALNLLRLADQYKVQKFVHASTGSVYGEAQVLPQSESHPLHPVSFYGVSKLAGERYVDVFRKNYALNTTILRYFHVYGPRQESTDVGGVVTIFIRRIMEGKELIIHGDGLQERSFTFVGDVVQANLNAATHSQANSQVYNCASGIKVSIIELANRVKQILGVPDHPVRHVEPLVGDIRKFDIDNSLIKKDLNIDFERDLGKGLDQTIRWAQDFFSEQQNVQRS